MPYTFPYLKTYTIDYTRLLEECISSSLGPIFSTEKVARKYFSEWIDLLYTAEQHSNEGIEQQLKNNRSELIYLLKNQEFFRQPMYFKTATLSIHFKITDTFDSLKTNREIEKYSTVSADRFIGNSPDIFWTPVDKLDSSFEPKKLPILIVQSYVDNTDLLLIDGRHRLTSWLQKGRKSIPFLCLPANEVIRMKLFATHFDLLAFTFCNDYSVLMGHKQDQDCSDEELMKMSALYTGFLGM